MTITSTSPLTDVFLAHIASFHPNSSDIANWTALTPPTGESNVTTEVGLFGADLTSFLADCAIATTNCKSADYINYNGFTLYVEWVATTAPTAGDVNSVTFASHNQWVANQWGTTNAIKAGTYKTTPAISVPAKGDLTLDTEDGPFLNWDGELQALSKLTQLAITFIDSTSSSNAFQVGDTATIWAHKNYAGGVASVVTFGGAASLAAEAGFLAVALLF